MNEVRRDPSSGCLTIYAPGRDGRPRDLPAPRRRRRPRPAFSRTCPFCPGNEGRLPPIMLETRGRAGAPWQTRVTVNKFPALSPRTRPGRGNREGRGEGAGTAGGLFALLPSHGHHEVVIESPLHNRDLAEMTAPAVAPVIETYHARYLALMNDPEVRSIVIFRNHGARAGISLVHPHSQIIATPFVPPAAALRRRAARGYFEAQGRCVTCDIIEGERRDGARVIRENRRFIAFVPFAAAAPFEIWIVPKRHQEGFDRIEAEEKAALAAVLRDMLSRLRKTLGDPDYNLIVNSPLSRDEDPAADHWYVSIHPRLTTLGGFEIGAGIAINPSLPERDAGLLRAAA